MISFADMRTLRRFCSLFLLCITLYAQILIVSPAEITGDSAAHALGTSGVARWIQIIAPSGNSAVIRIGDSNTSASRGLPIAPGGGIMLPPTSQAPGYDLTRVFYYATTGDKVNIAWAK